MPPTSKRQRRGFTLIELMIVVAIIGLLAAIAIPNFMLFQLRSKAAEARVNMKAIATAQHTYFAEAGRYVPAPAAPAGGLTPNKRPWTGGGVPSFQVLGWAPEGEVYFSYQIDVDPTAAAFTTGAAADLVGNGTPSEFGYIHPIAGTAITVASGLAVTCNPAGVFHPSGSLQLDTPGPCTAADGFSEF